MMGEITLSVILQPSQAMHLIRLEKVGRPSVKCVSIGDQYVNVAVLVQVSQFYA